MSFQKRGENKMRLENKVVIVTGATSSIGRASALLFAKEGAKVVAAGRRKDLGESLIEEIKAAGGEAVYFVTDVMKEEDLDALVKRTIDTYGRIDALFNNAGIAYSAPLEVFDQEQFDRVVEMNLRSPYLLTRKCMPYLLETKGNILNTGSISGLRATAMGYAYNSSKFALNGLTKVLALDYAGKGIRINSINPGVTLTDILSTVDDVAMEGLKLGIPMRRLALPEEIAAAALFLISDEASYITGQTIAVDGGFTL